MDYWSCIDEIINYASCCQESGVCPSEGNNSQLHFCQELKEQKEWLDKLFDSPMPLIGVYIAAASLVCTLAMAADLIHGIRRKKLWFPCKFFTVNAASLTVLAVAMKLPVDLTTGMWNRNDNLANLSSNVLMTTAMGNFLISLASVDDNAIFPNIIALGILVLTIIVNVCLEIRDNVLDLLIMSEEIFVIVFMLALFLLLTSSALTTPTTKRYLELKYKELHKKACNGGKIMDETGKLITNQKLKEVVEKHWVMAETSSPQFVMARSVVAAMSGVICLLTILTLVEAVIRLYLKNYRIKGLNHWVLTINRESPYKWSTTLILVSQSVGVMCGTIAPMFRWFTLIRLNLSNGDSNNHQCEPKLVENYWIERLVEWKQRPLAVQISSLKCRKFIHFTKNLILDLCIGIQFGIVVASKGVRFISIFFGSPLRYCCMKLKRSHLSESHAPSPVQHGNAESTEHDLSDYVLQLEGEARLPKRILDNIHWDMYQLIKKGKRQQPKRMMELLRKSSKSFKGVVEFDSSQVPDMLHEKTSNCWTLPVVTLTSIAIALPNIEKQTVDKLLSSVSEGLLYASLVEKSFFGDDFLEVKKKVDVIWESVELDCKWMSEDLQKLALASKTSKETLQSLVEIAIKSINEFKTKKKTRILIKNPLTMPAGFIAANSMYRISQTILNNNEGVTNQTDENLFEHFCCMIADILGACLTNLPRVITLKCYHSVIEERNRSVTQAARLLGETEEILEFLRDHDIPSLEGDRATFIDEWRACMDPENPPACDGSALTFHSEIIEIPEPTDGAATGAAPSQQPIRGPSTLAPEGEELVSPQPVHLSEQGVSNHPACVGSSNHVIADCCMGELRIPMDE